MRTFRVAPLLLAAACGGRPSLAVAPAAFAMPDSTLVLDGRTGDTLPTAGLLHRVGEADVVLLGEVHDNPVDHVLRGALISAFAPQRPAVVFEQFADGDAPIAPPAPGQAIEEWLDSSGFDRRGWRWPLHAPVIEAAIAHARSLWGANLSRDDLMPVVREGESAVRPPIRRLMDQAPLDSAGIAAMDSTLLVSHCGQLPPSMLPGMRAAQVARDAAMARALILAGAGSGRRPEWLIAGNGHVQSDLGVPRILRKAVPRERLLAVGLLERDERGALPSVDERRGYDVVIVTPRAEREDPCGGR